jgi:hypothetical protein
MSSLEIQEYPCDRHINVTGLNRLIIAVVDQIIKRGGWYIYII